MLKVVTYLAWFPSGVAVTAGLPNKQRARRGEVPKRILLAAISQLEADGLFSFSLKAATDAAEVHMAQAYGRWTSKAELLRAVADDLEERTARRMRLALQRTTGSARPYTAIEAYIRSVHQLQVSAFLPAIRNTIGQNLSATNPDWTSSTGHARARRVARRALRNLAAPVPERSRDVFLQLAHEIGRSTERPDIAPALGAALHGLIEGIGLQTAREARSRPVEDFIYLAHKAAHALISGFLAVPPAGAVFGEQQSEANKPSHERSL